MLERINGRLRAEGIPPVEMIILKWRVSQLLRDIQRKFGTLGSTSPTIAYFVLRMRHGLIEIIARGRQYVARNAEHEFRIRVANPSSSGADPVG